MKKTEGNTPAEQLLPFVEPVKLDKHQEDKLRLRLEIKRQKKIAKKLYWKLVRESSKKAMFMKNYQKTMKRFRHTLRWEQYCKNVYEAEKTTGRQGSHPVMRCKLDNELCKFQCGVLGELDKWTR